MFIINIVAATWFWLILSHPQTVQDVERENEQLCCNIPLLKSQSVRRAEKVTIYKTLIRPVVTYGAEVWTLLKGWQFLNEKF